MRLALRRHTLGCVEMRSKRAVERPTYPIWRIIGLLLYKGFHVLIKKDVLIFFCLAVFVYKSDKVRV